MASPAASLPLLLAPWAAPPKVPPLELDFVRELRDRVAGEPSSDAAVAARAFARALTEARAALLKALRGDGGDGAGVEEAEGAYLALLAGATGGGGGGAPAAPSAPAPDAADAAERGESAATSDARLRRALRFAWPDVVALPSSPSAPAADRAVADAWFEAASVRLACAGWRARAAGRAAAGAGADADALLVAHKLLRAAAGDAAAAVAVCETKLDAAAAVLDTSPAAARCVAALALADAQAITASRALAKGNAPSLIAALAADAADQYGAAAAAAANAGAAGAAAHARQRADALRCVAYVSASTAALADGKGGDAVALAGAATAAAGAAARAAAAAERALPRGPARDAARDEAAPLNAWLAATATEAARTAAKENGAVFFQVVPSRAPDLPAPRRLAEAIPAPTPTPPPAQAGVVAAGFVPAPPGDGGGGGGGGAPSTCGRWALVALALPLLLAVSLLSALVWIMLLPLKVCCCPVGCAAGAVWAVVEWGLKAPARALLYASGKPWKPQGGEEKEDMEKGGPRAEEKEEN
jgi:hypothetical protein